MLRQAGADDATRIAQLHMASWRATYARELPAEFLASQDVEERAAGWRSRIRQGDIVLLAEGGPGLRGFVACGPVRGEVSMRPTWEIYNLHVAPELHGQGIGTTLFEQAAGLGRERGAGALVLWVVDSNLPARRFYERRGMQHDGGRQDHAVGQEHVLKEVRYRMRLPGGRDCHRPRGRERTSGIRVDSGGKEAK